MSERGSVWRRWDPHLHAPGTLLADRFGGDWETYLREIEASTPEIRVLGVTDYFCIRTYKEARRRQAEGRLPNVELLFPNVELRLDISTTSSRAINAHILFSPHDPDHEAQIQRILGELSFPVLGSTYRCTEDDLARLGRDFDPSQTDPRGALKAGASQFKASWTQLKELFEREEWLVNNALFAIAGGRSDGTSGLQRDDTFTATRQELERRAHVIFAGTPSQRDFWLGRGTASVDQIESTYGFLKPCLIGSDAHSVAATGAPALERFCWVKGDPTFEALRQAVIEPEERVWIGPSAPESSDPRETLASVEVRSATWLKSPRLEFNPGLVAIIGERGSGKTALADVLARACGWLPVEGLEPSSSFLKKASTPVDLLGEATASVARGDGSTSESVLSLSNAFWPDDGECSISYLSQHFVESLCSATGLATELRREMERVVFEATDPVDQQEADTFEQLVGVLLAPVRHRREELRRAIRSASDEIVREEALASAKPVLDRRREMLAQQIGAARERMSRLLPEGSDERAAKLTALQDFVERAQERVESLNRVRQALSNLLDEVRDVEQHLEPERLRGMRARHRGTGLTDEDWNAFRMVFDGDPERLIEAKRVEVEAQIRRAKEGEEGGAVDTSGAPDDGWPLKVLRAERERLHKEVGTDKAKQTQYVKLQKTVERDQAQLLKLEAEIGRAGEAPSRRTAVIAARRKAYEAVFDTFDEEEKLLRKLYEPLERELAGATGALRKLGFNVSRRVFVEPWVESGERLFDLRLNTRLRGHGALARETDRRLAPAWKEAHASDVAAAMDAFREELGGEFLAAKPASVGAEERGRWAQRIAEWLYDTSHVSVEYSIQYDGVAVEGLSPGTRGIVLLLLYLAVDRADTRPLIVDQPEENLDPKSVFTELVPHFREARKRRQVFVVTHNANLVVNTDVDQIVIAEAERESPDELPVISYKSGSLENTEIRRAVCDILEGGKRAFLERERRYRLRWSEPRSK